MRRLLVLLAAGLVGCSFNPSGLAPGQIDAPTGDDVVDAPGVDAPDLDAPELDAAIDASIDASIDAVTDAAIDAAPPPLGDIIHVRPGDESIGNGDLTITNTLTITTSGTPSADMALPTGVALAVVQADGGGGDLVLLRVRSLTIAATGVLRAVGTRPLVILAEDVVANGWIDVAAVGPTAGAGALTAGGGAGHNGAHVSSFSDGGGGGGSFGGNGGDGGDAPCDDDCQPNQTAQGGMRGMIYGNANLDRLEGGSPGGSSFFPAATACPQGDPGGGGGALEVYARTSIMIGGSGGITAGGGGGDGGNRCDLPGNWLAGYGGGAGGAIYLQSASIVNAGLLVANGGGGGAGAGQGGNGPNGGSAGRSAAAGTAGAAIGTFSAAGGGGASQASAAGAGANGPDQGNGGGGGGGVGRIHVRSHNAAVLGTTSPTATTSTF